MIIQLSASISPEEKQHITSTIQQLGYKPNEVATQRGHYIVAIGKKEFDIRALGSMTGVRDIHRVSDDYKLVSNKWKVNRTAIDLGDGVLIGDGSLAIMAGPRSIENEKQIDATINHLKENGVRIMRGGVFKPRSSPYAFRGLRIDGLKLWHSLAQKAGVKIVREVMQVSQIDDMVDYVEEFQVDARKTQNFNLLDELG